jgi:hypothetical protein
MLGQSTRMIGGCSFEEGGCSHDVRKSGPVNKISCIARDKWSVVRAYRKLAFHTSLTARNAQQAR